MSLAFTWWAWAGVALILGILEVVLPASIFLGFAIGAAAMALILGLGGAALFSGSIGWLLVAFAAASLLAWLVLRYVFRLRVGQQVKVWKTDIND